MRVILLQYQIMTTRMLGVRNVFMANHTWVKPPFWWMLYGQRHARLAGISPRHTTVPPAAYNKSDVFDFSDPHVDLLAHVDGQADVEEVVFVGHAAHLHEGQEVTLVAAALVVHDLEGAERDVVPGPHGPKGRTGAGLSRTPGTLEMAR